MKPLISIAEKTPISPLTSEQLLLFEKDNVLQQVDKTFEDLSINPQDVLQIVKNIVELHEGTILASNRVKKRGAQVEVLLPKFS